MKTTESVNFYELTKIIVLDLFGAEVLINSLWKKQTAILVFLRHFGCPACRGHAYDVWNNREKYEQAGSKIIFIGNGTSDMIDQFKLDLNIPTAPIYVDPSLKSFKAMGFKRVEDPYNSLAMPNLKRYMDRGFKEADYGTKAGDGHQLGGIVVIKPNNTVAYHYISALAGDYPVEIFESPNQMP